MVAGWISKVDANDTFGIEIDLRSAVPEKRTLRYIVNNRYQKLVFINLPEQVQIAVCCFSFCISILLFCFFFTYSSLNSQADSSDKENEVIFSSVKHFDTPSVPHVEGERLVPLFTKHKGTFLLNNHPFLQNLDPPITDLSAIRLHLTPGAALNGNKIVHIGQNKLESCVFDYELKMVCLHFCTNYPYSFILRVFSYCMTFLSLSINLHH